MPIEIVPLGMEHEDAYRTIIDQSDHSLFYHGLKYRDFLHAIIPDAQDEYLIGFEDGVATAALAVLSSSGPYGRVANSLPFYGSHGGVIYTTNASAEVRDALLARFHQQNRVNGTRWATMVGNPFAPQPTGDLQPSFNDQRIGQFTPLPGGDTLGAIQGALMEQCHQKTRNMVRKGLKQGYAFRHDGSPGTVDLLVQMHQENLRAIGGIAKGRAVFDAIVATFEYDTDYRIYRADTAHGECAATLLLFYFGDYVEYFVPCTLEAHRAGQPLSALIHLAMADAAAERGARWWNWGGTWLSQDGVYRFKSRWGTQDLAYDYRIWDYDPAAGMAGVSVASLAEGYPYFYTLPYGVLGG